MEKPNHNLWFTICITLFPGSPLAGDEATVCMINAKQPYSNTRIQSILFQDDFTINIIIESFQVPGGKNLRSEFWE